MSERWHDFSAWFLFADVPSISPSGLCAIVGWSIFAGRKSVRRGER